MWKEYSLSYIKNNKTSGISVIAAAFISALLLSLLGCLFYNLWKSDVDQIIREEGDWQGRITGEIDEETLTAIRNYANVEKVIIKEELSGDEEIVVDIYFKNMRTVLKDMPLISEIAAPSAAEISYHHSLLSMYLIRDPLDPAPRLLFPFFILVTLMACFSLIMIIHNSFAVSMNARVHQFGIFSSIGATPAQIRVCLLQEALFLTVIPVILGNLFGIMISIGVIAWTNTIAVNAIGRYYVLWQYHPLVFGFTILAAVLTILISAWIPARKLSRLTPLEAIRNADEIRLKKKKRIHPLGILFGIEGELAGNALKAQKKALRTSTLSLTLSFLAFTLMLCFFTLSGISTEMTYFTKYQDVWDVMVTVKDTEIDHFLEKGFGETAFQVADALQELPDVENITLYQKAAAKRILTEDELSTELYASEILQNASESMVTKTGDAWLVNAPIMILDDISFLEYCEQIGIEPHPDGTIILNRIWDSTSSNFRNRKYIPYLREDQKTAALCRSEQTEIFTEVPVLAYTENVPALRESYNEAGGLEDDFVLVHFIPLSMWQEIKEQIGNTEADSYIRVLAKEDVTLAELDTLQKEVTQIIGPDYEIEIENRLREKIDNDEMIRGMMTIIGGFCVLLAIIGIANVFSNTLGFIRQRKREFARYMSVGLTPGGMRKIFCIEAFMIAANPLFITLPFTVVSVYLMCRASYLEFSVFLAQAPVAPILIFILAIFVFVALAYYLGGRKILRCNLAESLKDDTMR